MRMPRDIRPHLIQQQQNFLGLTLTEINHVDHVTLMFDEVQPLLRQRTGSRRVRRFHASNPSTTPYAASKAASRAEASSPPASAISGRPPPFPPTFCATGPIPFPACT